MQIHRGLTYKVEVKMIIAEWLKSTIPRWQPKIYANYLLGISKRTKAKSCVKNHSVQQIIESPIESHSTKPDEVRARIIQLLGDIPRIELFARNCFEGWDCWGDDEKIKFENK